MMRYILVPCCLLMFSWSLIHSTPPPSDGAIVQKEGELQFVEGLLLAHTTLSIQEYLETNTALIQNQMEMIMPVIERTRESLTDAHLATLRRGLHNNVFMYRQLLSHLNRMFMYRRLNITDPDDYVNSWITRIASVIDSRNQCTCPLPGCLPPCPRNSTPMTTRSPHSYKSAGQVTTTQKGKNRPKRGWIDLGGVILNTVLGTATEEQIRQVNTSVSHVKLATYRLEIKTNHLIELVGKSLGYISEVVKTLQDTSNQLDELSRYIILHQLITEISTVIKHLVSVSLETETRIALLRKGIMPPILTEEHVLSLIREGMRRFPDLVFPLSPHQVLKSNSSEYTNILKSFPTADPHVFVVGVPFVSRTNVYDLYKFTPFPVKNAMNQLVMPTLNNYIAKSATDFVELQTLSNCDHVNSVYLCDNLTARRTNMTTCENSILANDLPRLNATCNYYQVELDRGYYAAPIGKSWYVYFEKQTHGTVVCPGSRINKVIELQGLIRLEPPCSLQTSQITFTTVETAAVNLTQVPTVKIPLTPLDVIPVQVSSPDQSILTNINNDLAQLKMIEKKATIQDADWSIQMPIIFSASGLAFVLLILIAFIIGFLCHRHKHAASEFGDPEIDAGSLYSHSRSSVRSGASVRPGILRQSSVPASITGTL